jgi:outer membrane protein assembly factor BamB
MTTWIIAALFAIGLSGWEDPIDVINGTFLGNWERNYYGNSAPDNLEVQWKHYLGKGETRIGRTRIVEWAGAGWTGQPLMVREGREAFLIQGAYDHRLKKINASTGELVWEYAFDDMIKGTGTLWTNAGEYDNSLRWIILQGSRLGLNNLMDSNEIYSFRAISYMTGKEVWRHNVQRTHSYSRDVDASALVWKDTAYIGLENSLFTVLDPDPANAFTDGEYWYPLIHQQESMYTASDVILHEGNVVTESSPSKIGDMIYVASGAGRVWGFDLKKKQLTWNFFVGSDLDGSAIVTRDSCLLVTVEKQYIDGRGGVIKLDPSQEPAHAVVWYLPVSDNDFEGWEGGVIGSPAVSDHYNDLRLGACLAIDGNLYVFRHDSLSGKKRIGFDGHTLYPSPHMVFSYRIGESISTPVFTGSHLVACGYDGIYLFAYDNNARFRLLDSMHVPVESTPFIWNQHIYIAARNGYLYCLGSKD